MRKKTFLLLTLLLLFLTLVACAPTHEQQIQQRIDEYANEMYFVFWGNQYKEAKLPEKLVTTRNEFDADYTNNRLRKVVFITDSYTALNLTEDNIAVFLEMIKKGFNLCFYDYNKFVISAVAQKFGISTDNLANGSNYFFIIKDCVASFEYSSINAAPISSQVILTTILERMTH